jgi:FKBP-type peptidyl-prolyl cis-trans isomerase FklB
MNKLFLFLFVFLFSYSVYGQTTKVAPKPAKPATPKPGTQKPVATKSSTPQPLLKNLDDSASYAIGYSMGNISKSQGLSVLNTSLVTRAFDDITKKRPCLMSETSSRDFLNKYVSQENQKGNVAKPSNQAILKTLNDSLSYAISLNHALFFSQQGITKINSALVTRALNDVLGNKPCLINDAIANNVMNKLMTEIQEKNVQVTIDAGNTFLANNKKKPGVNTTPSGLQYEVITMGTGIKPTAVDTFVCHYRGTLLDGTEFDASYKRNQPLIYGVSQVIRGWTEGLQLMPVGSKFKFYIPYTLAYGAFDNPPIPGGSMLIFELELLDVKKKG